VEAPFDAQCVVPFLALIVAGLLIGAGGVIGTQVIVAATETNEFYGGACHSMQWVAQEHAHSDRL